jgi:hypothetical protein
MRKPDEYLEVIVFGRSTSREGEPDLESVRSSKPNAALHEQSHWCKVSGMPMPSSLRGFSMTLLALDLTQQLKLL